MSGEAAIVEYYERGRGPAVAMMHGGNCCADDWANIVPSLSKNHRLILPDGLVHPLDPWHVWLLLDHLGVREVVLIGHSAGGTLARKMYCLQPDRVRAIVAVDADTAGSLKLARKLPDELRSARARALGEKNRASMEQLKPHHRGDYPSDVTIQRRLLAYRREKMRPEERARTRTWPAPSAFCIDNPPPAPQPISDGGKFIRCPILIIQTGRGKIGPEDISREWIAENIQARKVEYVVLKECGHWPWLEQREVFLGTLEPFLDRLR